MREFLDEFKMVPLDRSRKPKLEDYENVDCVFEYVISMIRLSIAVGSKGLERDDWLRLIEILLSVDCSYQEYNTV